MEPSEQKEHVSAGQWAPGCRSGAKATCSVGPALSQRPLPSARPPTHEGTPFAVHSRPPTPHPHMRSPVTKHQCLFPGFTESQTTFR